VSIYRWLAELDRDGASGIETARPERTISRALPAPLVDFLAKEKAEDRYASVPELIRRAREHGVIGPHERADRSSVWRACVRLGLPLRRVPRALPWGVQRNTRSCSRCSPESRSRSRRESPSSRSW
jgi:hypothetical protein